MQARSLKNRTLWHSGLLLILLLFTQNALAEVQLTVGSQVVSKSGAVVVLDDAESGSFGVDCKLLEYQFKVIQWKLNDRDLETKNVIASQETVTLTADQLSQTLNKLECFVNVQDNIELWSYAFVYISKSKDPELQEPSISLSFLEGSSEVSLGGRVSLKCKVEIGDEGQKPEFQWIKNARPLDLAKSKSFDLKVISDDEQHLVFDGVSHGDSGNYGCLVKGTKDQYDETSLRVIFAPILKTGANPEISSKAGESVSLPCEVVSAFPPAVEFSWFKDEQPLSCDQSQECSLKENDDLKSELILTNLNPAASGDYSCFAKNAAGSASVSTLLNVLHDPPVINRAEVKGEKVRQLSDNKFLIFRGSSGVRLECHGTGFPEPDIVFVHSDVDHPNPVVFDVASTDALAGTWQCVARNNFGQQDEKTLEVLIATPTSFQSPVENQVHVHVGENLTLVCDYQVDEHFRDLAKVSWSFNGKRIDQDPKTPLVKPASIKNTISGEYGCKVDTPFESVTKLWTVELIQRPVIVNTFPSKVLKVFGEKVVIPCFSGGIPSPKITWQKDDSAEIPEFIEKSLLRRIEDAPENVQPVLLEINQLNAEDVGLYKCVSENSHGDVHLGIVVVGVQPTRLDDSFKNETIVNAGESFTLRCPVVVDNAVIEAGPVTRMWQKDGKYLDQYGETVSVAYAIEGDNGGIYTCTVETAADRVTVVQRIIVNSSPPFVSKFKGNVAVSALKRFPEYYVIQGSNLTVTCNVTKGIPHPQITWKKSVDLSEKPDSLKIYETNQTLQLTNLEVNDEGNYSCLAVNEYGQDQKSFHLNVLNSTAFTSIQDQVVAETLVDVKFECNPTVDKRLKPTFSWYDNQNQLIPGATSSTLSLRSVTKSEQGHYVCVASTEFDSANSTHRLLVNGEPPAFISTEKDVRVLEGNNVTVSCQANGLPLPKISWFKNGVELKDRRFSVGPLGDLTLTLVSLGDAGEYTCKAANIYGKEETISFVEVLKRADTGSTGSGNVKNVGENVTLVCDVTFDPRVRSETKTRWFFRKDEKDVQIPIYDPSKFTSKKIKPKYEVKDNLLRITDLRIDDKGIYECRVETPFEKIQYTINLFVNGEAPKILSDLKKQSVNEGDTLELTCLVKGSPRPSLRWLFNDRPIPSQYIEEVETLSPAEYRESRVRIAGVSKKDEGVYQCETSNLYGSGVAKFAKVNVIGRTSVRIGAGGSDVEKEIVVHAGEKLKIPCRVDNDPANRIMNITWDKDGKAIKVTSEDRIDFGMDGSVTIANVQKRHSGVYRCTAITALDSANDTVPLRVVVNAPVITNRSPSKQIVFDGESITLICNANGIPEPKISWVFNKTRTNVAGSEYRVNNAIISDTGEYVCEARNEYGQTKHVMEVEVVLLPSLPSEIFVDLGSSADLSCLTSHRDDIEVTWQKDYKDVLNFNTHTDTFVQPNGTLTIANVSENSIGNFMCTVSAKNASNSRKRILTTTVRLRPVIIMSVGGVVNVVEGTDTTLACLILPGSEAKRLWRYNGEFFAHDSRRDLKRRGERLEIRGVKLSDAGNYTCVAVQSNDRDSVSYDLRVTPKSISTHSKDDESVCSTLPLTVLEVYRVDNSTIQVWWTDHGLDRSCYTEAKLAWWNNTTDISSNTSSVFLERVISLDEKVVTIGGISSISKSSRLVYYVQVNLVAPHNRIIYGETRSFVPSELQMSPNGSEGGSENDLLLSRTRLDRTMVVTLVIVFLVVIAAVLTMSIFFYRRKYSKNPKAVDRLCRWRRKHCSCFKFGGSSRSSHSSARYGKTNFNGFDRGAFEGAIIISSPMSVVGPGIPEEEEVEHVDDYEFNGAHANLNRHSRFSVYRGSAYLVGNKNNSTIAQSTSDFMTNPAPQWPEPEEPVSSSLANIHHTTGPLAEREPFLAPKRHKRTSPSRKDNNDLSPKRRSQSKESISSSWSSLFNVPVESTSPQPDLVNFAGTSVAIRPNSAASPILNNSEPTPSVSSFKNRIV